MRWRSFARFIIRGKAGTLEKNDSILNISRDHAQIGRNRHTGH
jgi:hypothetical protein